MVERNARFWSWAGNMFDAPTQKSDNQEEMPFDPFFLSSAKLSKETKRKRAVAARCKQRWPTGSQFKPKAGKPAIGKTY